MPEIKQTFLGGKMNKDLDSRIIPTNEYREARNLNITKSEGSGVGSLETVAGTVLQASSAGLNANSKIIGSYADDRDNRLFVFITDNNGINGGTNHEIGVFNKNTSAYTTIVSGAFLKFDQNYLITGIGLLENILLWTDNLNQPRRIDVDIAIGDPTFYSTEVKISVARPAPVYAPRIKAAVHDGTIVSNHIEEKFVRFAYRYKFSDNQYSVISPFTATAFKMSSNVIADVASVYTSTELSFMKNSVNKITMDIAVISATPVADYQIKEVEVLYKEAGDLAIRVIDTIDVATASIVLKDWDVDTVAEEGTIEYIYKSTGPKSTLSPDQLTRVYDKVPLKAKTLAIAGNRVMYGNITEGAVVPVLDYSVAYAPKSAAIVTANPILENQTVKSRRTLQVGVVLSDIFGRSTPVILSDSSTVTIEAKDDLFDNSTWDGDSLTIVFGTAIPNAYDASTNPLGWYSYRVVVKQQQQEYYNVYTAGAINTGIGATKSYIQLFGDNVNKVPRNTDNADITGDKGVPSDERLWPKVINEEGSTYIQSDGSLIDVISIGDKAALGVDGTFTALYDIDTNPLLACLAAYIGQDRLSFDPDFAIFETEPFETSLDLFYETPNSGKVAEINTNINSILFVDWSVANGSISTDIGNVPESTVDNAWIASLYAYSSIAPFTEISSGSVSYTLNSGHTVGGKDRYDIAFDSGTGRYRVRLIEPFMYNAGDFARTLNITANYGGVQIIKNITITETNVAPTASGPATSKLQNTVPSGTKVADFTAVNGTSDPILQTQGITWSIVSALHNSIDVSASFTFDQDTPSEGGGRLKTVGSIAGLSDTFDVIFVLRATDANGLTDDHNFQTDLTATASYGTENIWKASYQAFNTVAEACAAATTDPRWSPVTVYFTIGEDPIPTANSAWEYYADTSLSVGADSAWYRNLSDGAGQWLKGSPGAWTQIGTCTQ